MGSKKKSEVKRSNKEHNGNGEKREKLLAKVIKRMERMEAMLLEIEARLEVIEKALGVSSDPLLRRALELSKVEISLATNLLRNYYVISMLPKSMSDDISIAILISLISGPKTISQISEDVRKMRGKGSRRIISERLKTLERIGILKHEKKGNKKIFYISSPKLTPGSPSSQRSNSEPS